LCRGWGVGVDLDCPDRCDRDFRDRFRSSEVGDICRVCCECCVSSVDESVGMRGAMSKRSSSSDVRADRETSGNGGGNFAARGVACDESSSGLVSVELVESEEFVGWL
jgi:hypothetical protein